MSPLPAAAAAPAAKTLVLLLKGNCVCLIESFLRVAQSQTKCDAAGLSEAIDFLQNSINPVNNGAARRAVHTVNIVAARRPPVMWF